MTTDDLPEFAELLDSVCTTLSRGQYRPNETSTAMWFRVLAPFPIQVVRAALDEHVRTSKFVPTPHEVLALIAGNDGRPGDEEAWALVLRDRDDDPTHERLTTVWTREMLAAWGFARPVLAAGDKIGARMAFREAYNREVELARRRCEPVRWEVSLGSDKQAAAEVVRAAVADGRIHLPKIGKPGDEVTLLLESAAAPRRLALPAPERDDSPVAAMAKVRLQAWVESMRAEFERPSADAAAKQATAELRDAAAARAAGYADADLGQAGGVRS